VSGIGVISDAIVGGGGVMLLLTASYCFCCCCWQWCTASLVAAGSCTQPLLLLLVAAHWLCCCWWKLCAYFVTFPNFGRLYINRHTLY